MSNTMRAILFAFALASLLLTFKSSNFATNEDSLSAAPCANGSARRYSCKGVNLQAHIPLRRFASKPSSASNVWGYVDPDDRREYALIGLYNGTAIVDVTNPVRPRVVNIIRGRNSPWREVKVYSFRNTASGKWDAYAYITTEAIQGIQIIDLSGLPRSAKLERVEREISTSHTAFVSNVDFATAVAKPGLTPYLYIEGADAFLPRPSSAEERPNNRKPTPQNACSAKACMTNLPGTICTCGGGCSCARANANPGFKVFSLEDPRNPTIVGSYEQTYMHDVYVETFSGERARQCARGHDPCEVVFGWTGQDFRIIDFTDKQRPKVLSTVEYENLGYPHSGWISRNKLWLFSFDELDEVSTGLNTRVLSLKINDLRNPEVFSQWRGSTGAIEHNGYVKGNKLYISSYTRGLVVLNVRNPGRPREVAFFDTHPENDDPDFRGAWGVYPFLPSKNILISDINRGLFILKEQ